MKTHKIILAGGTGFLGRHLRNHYERRGDEVIVLSRHPKQDEVFWDGKSVGPWQETVNGADVLINLAGKNVNCRYTPRNRREIIDSRCESVAILGKTLQELPNPPSLWIQASSLAIYGDTGEAICEEDSPIGLSTGRRLRLEQFPVQVCQLWEEAFQKIELPGIRKVCLRIGFVLGQDEGILRFLANLTRFFLGGTVLPGTQYVSWIHIADWVRLIQWLMEHPTATGIYNASTPHPVSYSEMMRGLRSVLGRPWSPPVPEFATHLGAWLFGSEPALALSGRRCVSARLAREGFEFQFTDIHAALRHLYTTQH